MKCYNWRQPGHMIKDCNKPIRPPNSCFTCGAMDHQFRSCPKRATGKLQQTVAHLEEQQSVADILGKHLPC
ncbi:ATP-dependent RNA helicase glh-2-like [Drosophila rhopaloa]|uniref:CCHC-type domain-containing protein n=1 Tax=Drosophila rhopaloa TaxID=1041015 RepID=A0ABM5GXU4_DRORH|nr:ATP-dependent RNA helicase glh-2-like [Drosophila rhopaloa]